MKPKNDFWQELFWTVAMPILVMVVIFACVVAFKLEKDVDRLETSIDNVLKNIDTTTLLMLATPN